MRLWALCGVSVVGEGVSDSIMMCEWCVAGARTAVVAAWRAKGGLMRGVLFGGGFRVDAGCLCGHAGLFEHTCTDYNAAIGCACVYKCVGMRKNRAFCFLRDVSPGRLSLFKLFTVSYRAAFV